MNGDETTGMCVAKQWSKRKKDSAPRGVFRHKSGTWGIRYTCGAGHIHQEKAGPIKSEAVRAYHERRSRAHNDPGWCPKTERQRERARVQAERARERARITFREYADDYVRWAEAHKRSWRQDRSRLSSVLTPLFGDRPLDEITTADVERFRDGLLSRVTAATTNRYRDLLSGMFKRALRVGLVAMNPVTPVAKMREAGQRIVWLTRDEEAAVRDALPPDLRSAFTVAVNTGLRWSEQAGLYWRDVDMLAGVITVARGKNGRARWAPMNSVVRSVLVDLGSERRRADDPAEPVFAPSYWRVVKVLSAAVQRAQATIREAGGDATRLDGFTWHGCRHTFASRLVMAGVDPRTVQELGGWRTLGMVQRYAHLSPAHLHAAVDRLVGAPTESPEAPVSAVELRENFDSPEAVPAPVAAGVS